MACNQHGLHARIGQHRELLSVALAALLIAAAWAAQAAGAATAYRLLMAAAAVIAGLPIAREALGRLRARQFSIPLLVSVAATGALIIGEPWEAAAVTFLYAFGGWLEGLTLARTRSAVRALVDMAPRTARVKRSDGELAVIPAEAVRPGETVVVLPGDRVPVDGTVSAGQAALDTAALTGEPLPREVGPGQAVMSGSVSQAGYLEVRAERAGADTTFSRMIYLVAEAQEGKPRVQRLLDRFARWYTPAVMAAAVGLYLFTRDIRLALTFLVIGCPGALLVAAPVAVVAGLGAAARQGVLIKGGERLERISKVDVVAFDKTGTLTRGRPEVTAVVPFRGDSRTLVAVAAAAEQRSEHHLAAAILAHARAQGIAPAAASDWTLKPGLGAVARGEAGEILVGSRRLLQAHGLQLTLAQADTVALHAAAGETVALVAADGQVQGLLGITDPLRPEAEGLIAALKQKGVRRTLLLTGDNRATAERTAQRLGIDAVRAELLPGDKVAAIREQQAAGQVVAMIGDGVNDAPALAAADVSIAMGASGTQAALEAADIALMGDRLAQVPYAIGLSRRIRSIVQQNVAFAVAVVLLLLAGVVTRNIYLGSGMLIHEASVLLVIVNGMRLLGRRKAFSPAAKANPVAAL